MERAEIILSSITHGEEPNSSNKKDDRNSGEHSLSFEVDQLYPTSKEPQAASAGNIWKKSLDILDAEMDSQIFLAWIKPLKAINFIVTPGETVGSSIGKITLGAPNKFCCNHVNNEYKNEILNAASQATGVHVAEIAFEIVRPQAAAIVEKPAARPNTRSAYQSTGFNRPRQNQGNQQSDNSSLNPRYNFSNYVVGGCNQFAHAACLRVAENLGRTYNPLFIYGGVGLGKTHLANAIGNASRRRNKKVLLVSSETFVSELISSLRTNTMDRFKAKFRSLDLLIVDDIQFLIGKERTQEEFFHTFNELHNRHSQIIITSDKIPQELTGLEERLKTRFASGLSVDLQVPDFETRVAILKKKSESYEIVLQDEVARLIADRIDTNVRELEGALNRLTAYCSLNTCEPNCRIAREVIDTIAPGRSREVTCDYIQEVVASRYNISIHDIVGKRRTQNIASARQVAMFLSRELTGCSYPELGAVFGGRDHSTVIHAVKVITEKMRKSAEFSDEIAQLRKSL